MSLPPNPPSEIHDQLYFANRFATEAGEYMWEARQAGVQESLRYDGTVTNSVAQKINQHFEHDAARRFSGHAVIGLDGDIGPKGQGQHEEAKDVWVINAMDAAEQFTAEAITEESRISCAIGIGKMVGNSLAFAVIYAPFKQVRYYAINGQGAFMNGLRLRVGTQEVIPGTPLPYDCHSDPQSGVSFPDLSDRFGPPLGEASPLLQACDVARGYSAFSAQATNGFNVGLGTLMVREAGGVSISSPYEPAATPPAISILHASPTAYLSAKDQLKPPRRL